MLSVKVMKFHFGFIWGYNVPTQTSVPTVLMWIPFNEIHLMVYEIKTMNLLTDTQDLSIMH
jgi:hypothetical protein